MHFRCSAKLMVCLEEKHCVVSRTSFFFNQSSSFPQNNSECVGGNNKQQQQHTTNGQNYDIVRADSIKKWMKTINYFKENNSQYVLQLIYLSFKVKIRIFQKLAFVTRSLLSNSYGDSHGHKVCERWFMVIVIWASWSQPALDWQMLAV